MTAPGELTSHRPVLYQETITALSPRQGGRYLDGTLGAGGHAWGILASSEPDGLLLGLDLDPGALSLAGERLKVYGPRVILRQASYATLAQQLAEIGWNTVNGIMLDLGVSSMQLDTPQRGFSFQTDAPLDMRFDPNNPLTAADLVNRLPERELADLIYRYGEDPAARRIARAIVNNRPIDTTQQLASTIQQTLGKSGNRAARQSPRPVKKTSHAGHGSGQKRNLHPATRTFQALRIAVNRELEALELALPQAVSALEPGGRLVILSFHSLEDRIVKQYFRLESRDCICPPRQPYCTCGHRALIREVTRRPLMPQPAEVAANPRSRSARLRAAEKLTRN